MSMIPRTQIDQLRAAWDGWKEHISHTEARISFIIIVIQAFTCAHDFCNLMPVMLVHLFIIV